MNHYYLNQKQYSKKNIQIKSKCRHSMQLPVSGKISIADIAREVTYNTPSTGNALPMPQGYPLTGIEEGAWTGPAGSGVNLASAIKPDGSRPTSCGEWHSYHEAASGSDIRLKTNIEQVGHTIYGIPLYEWNYKNIFGLDYINRYRGVMAQDLLKTVKVDAVILNDNGYYSVDYNQLDINLIKIQNV